MNEIHFQDIIEDKENLLFPVTPISTRTKDLSRSKPDSLPFFASIPPSVHTSTPVSSLEAKGKKLKSQKSFSFEKRNSPSPPSSGDESHVHKSRRRMVDEDTVFSCLTCFKKFDNVGDLQRHTKTHKMYPCAFCGAKFVDQGALRMHLFSHPVGKEMSQQLS
ncbi:zinc finger protein SNAI2-like [Palaemon carinicauda]|uniref:zinc finger protein SNAI2-like n=1 Tax=Palaemon carinicauda TaxID=392227 RepID=UPI0035B6586F